MHADPNLPLEDSLGSIRNPVVGVKIACSTQRQAYRRSETFHFIRTPIVITFVEEVRPGGCTVES